MHRGVRFVDGRRSFSTLGLRDPVVSCSDTPCGTKRHNLISMIHGMEDLTCLRYFIPLKPGPRLVPGTSAALLESKRTPPGFTKDLEYDTCVYCLVEAGRGCGGRATWRPFVLIRQSACQYVRKPLPLQASRSVPTRDSPAFQENSRAPNPLKRACVPPVKTVSHSPNPNKVEANQGAGL